MSMANLNVYLHDGRHVNIPVKPTDTWKNVKENLHASKEDIPEECVLFYSSALCNDEELVQDSSLTESSVIHCFIDKGKLIPDQKLQQCDAMELEVNIFQIVASSNYEGFIQKLKSMNKVSQLIAECPAVLDDPEFLGAIRDTTVLSSLVYHRTFLELLEEKPMFARLLHAMCNLAKSEEPAPRTRVNTSYALDDLSDDEEDMEIDQDESGNSSRNSNSQSRSADFLPITPAQLTAALANATGSSNSRTTLSSSAPRSGLPTPPSTSTPFNTPGLASASVTGGASPGTSTAMPTEVFSQALQTALAASARRSATTPNAETSSSSPDPPRDTTHPPPEFLESMQLMREMGITDDNMSAEALRATNGDVQAAINLIFAQWMAED